MSALATPALKRGAAETCHEENCSRMARRRVVIADHAVPSERFGRPHLLVCNRCAERLEREWEEALG